MYSPESLGCPIKRSGGEGFALLTRMMKGLGFRYDGSQEVDININDALNFITTRNSEVMRFYE